MKAGVILALGVGYVAGARAGRGRYRQIVSASQRVADTLERYASGRDGSDGSDGSGPWTEQGAALSGGRRSQGSWRDVVRSWAAEGEVSDDDGRSDTDVADRRSSVDAVEASDEFDRLISSGMHGGPPRSE